MENGSNISRDLQLRSKQLAERFSEGIHILDHDPSMALYRLQEHVNKVVPKLVDRKCQMVQLNSSIQGASFDLDNAIQTLEQMKKAHPTLERIQKGLRSSIHFQQQIGQEKCKNRDTTTTSSSADNENGTIKSLQA